MFKRDHQDVLEILITLHTIQCRHTQAISLKALIRQSDPFLIFLIFGLLFLWNWGADIKGGQLSWNLYRNSHCRCYCKKKMQVQSITHSHGLSFSLLSHSPYSSVPTLGHFSASLVEYNIDPWLVTRQMLLALWGELEIILFIDSM